MEVNRIYNEDVFKFLAKLKDNSVDLAIVDPPYNIKIDKWDTFNSEKDYLEFTFKWIDLLLPKLKTSGSFYLFNNNYNSALILNYLRNKDVVFQNWIVWYKKDGLGPTKKKFVNNQETILFYSMSNQHTFNADLVRVPYDSTSRIKAANKKGILKNGKRWYPNENGKLCPDVWEITSDRHKKKVNGKIVKSIHPTPKPEDMIERMILASSKENDLVLDLFSGTGTTAYIAKKNRRNFIGCEINNDYMIIINERLK